MQCPRCQQENPAGQKFCGECGTPLAGTGAAKPYAELKDENELIGHALSEALQQQIATSEILRVISQSHMDAQPVFDTIMQNAVRLCGAIYGGVYRFDGELVHSVANHNFTPDQLEQWRRFFPRAPVRKMPIDRAIRGGCVVRIPDVETDRDSEYPAETLANQRARGVRSLLIVPMLRQNDVIGVITLAHREVGAFSDAQVDLLKTFADQAVIAIENVRLFKELGARNRDLTATSEVLQVISRSPTNAQPVFDTIAERAEKLCHADLSLVARVEGELIHLAALHGGVREGVEGVRRVFPMRRGDETITARAVRAREVVHIPDRLADPHATPEAKDASRTAGIRGVLAVPMLRDEQVIGVIFVARKHPGYFADAQVDLLKTFADQAAKEERRERYMAHTPPEK